MTVTILASLSLLALVVTARPITQYERDRPNIDSSLNTQDAVQSVFRARTDHASLCSTSICEDASGHDEASLVAEHALGLLHLQDLQANKAADSQDEDEKMAQKTLMEHVREVFTGQGHTGIATDMTLDREPNLTHAESLPSSPVPRRILGAFWSPVTAILSAWCLVAFLWLGLVVATIYVRKLFAHWRGNFGAMLYNRLSYFEQPLRLLRNDGNHCPPSNGEKEAPDLNVDGSMPSLETAGDREEKKPRDLPADSITESSPTKGPKKVDVADEAPDPECLLLPAFETPFSSPPPSPARNPPRRLLPMRETPKSSTISRPAWSLRAADAPALGIASAPAIVNSSLLLQGTAVPFPVLSPSQNSNIHGTIPADKGLQPVAERPARRRAYRSSVPELDVAFAMQLRPGLGLGADPAWLVRFLMAMFGWMTVLLGNNAVLRHVERRAII